MLLTKLPSNCNCFQKQNNIENLTYNSRFLSTGFKIQFSVRRVRTETCDCPYTTIQQSQVLRRSSGIKSQIDESWLVVTCAASASLTMLSLVLHRNELMSRAVRFISHLSCANRPVASNTIRVQFATTAKCQSTDLRSSAILAPLPVLSLM
jgi:hypothetical protein